jgi:succinate dehydrogenase / fumarate reductase flavoprotein subunit
MQNLVGIFRVEEDLKKALGKLQELKARAAKVRIDGSRMFNPGWHMARDLRSMLIVAEAVTRAATARKESRGAHSRLDFPKFDDTWGKQNNIIQKKGDQMELRQTPVREMSEELKKILAEDK